MQLHAVQPRLPGPSSAIGEVLNGLFDLPKRHRLAKQPMKRIHLAGGRQALLPKVLDARVIPLPASMAELHEKPAVMAVHRFTYRSPERNFVVAVDHGVVRKNPPPHMHRN